MSTPRVSTAYHDIDERAQTDNVRATGFADQVELILERAYGASPWNSTQVDQLGDALRAVLGPQLKPQPLFGIGLCPTRCAWWPWQDNYISNMTMLERPQFVDDVLMHVVRGQPEAAPPSTIELEGERRAVAHDQCR